MIIEDSRNKSNMIGPTSGAGTDNQSGAFPAFCGIRVAQTLIVCVVCCISLFVVLFFFFWPFFCLSFFSLQFLTTSVSSNFSYIVLLELRMINFRLLSLFATQYTKGNTDLLWHMTEVYSRKSSRIVYIPHMGMWQYSHRLLGSLV